MNGSVCSLLAAMLFVVGLASTIASAAVNLNQHGLTGSWYQPATSGQGIEVEVFPDLIAPGTGSVFLSWFAFDSVVGGADDQRWYTAQGPVVSGQPSASLTIYENTGGNFNAPPVTAAQPVGTATLSFDTCSSGQLSYSFTDGTGRTGSIALTRLTQNVTCSTTSPPPVNADFGLSGNWFNPTGSGQGITAEVNPDSGQIFAAWYTYAPNGAGAGAAGQRWYTAEGAFVAGQRSIPVTIYQTTGGIFDTPTTPLPATVPVGSGTIAFQSCSAGTLSYSFTGGSSGGSSGTIDLSRVGPVPTDCTSSGGVPQSQFQQDLTPYATALLNVLPPALVDVNQFLGIILAVVDSIGAPGVSCPVVATEPDLSNADVIPTQFTASASFGTGCSVSDGYLNGTVAGSLELDVTDLVVTDTSLSGVFSLDIDNMSVNGAPFANGEAAMTFSLVVNPVSGAISLTADRSFTNFTGARVTFTGTMADSFNSVSGTDTVSTDITTTPGNVSMNLAYTAVSSSDGTLVLNSSGANSVGGYTVEINNFVVNSTLCPTGATAGTISFSDGRQTATLTFNSTCGYTYSGP
jgi:hypothetical protein